MAVLTRVFSRRIRSVFGSTDNKFILFPTALPSKNSVSEFENDVPNIEVCHPTEYYKTIYGCNGCARVTINARYSVRVYTHDYTVYGAYFTLTTIVVSSYLWYEVRFHFDCRNCQLKQRRQSGVKDNRQRSEQRHRQVRLG